jgi:hypothetical protein
MLALGMVEDPHDPQRPVLHASEHGPSPRRERAQSMRSGNERKPGLAGGLDDREAHRRHALDSLDPGGELGVEDEIAAEHELGLARSKLAPQAQLAIAAAVGGDRSGEPAIAAGSSTSTSSWRRVRFDSCSNNLQRADRDARRLLARRGGRARRRAGRRRPTSRPPRPVPRLRRRRRWRHTGPSESDRSPSDSAGPGRGAPARLLDRPAIFAGVRPPSAGVGIR